MSNQTTPANPASEDHSNFSKGLSLAILSTLFIGSSFIFKKKSLIRLGNEGGLRAGSGGFGYLRDRMWWYGLLLMAVGELTNFAAYIYAPASMVTPLGALSILVSAVLASRYLGEHLNVLGVIGCLLCILGSTVLVIFSPKEETVKNIDELADMLRDSGFTAYIFILIIVCLLIFCYVGPVYGKTYVCVYLTFCSAVGSVTVMACKALGIAISSGSWSTSSNGLLILVLFLTLAFCICMQMNYLNKTLDLFSTSIVTPIYYVMFTTLVIIASTTFFKEWQKMSGSDVAACICGFIVMVIAVLLLSVFKDHSQPRIPLGGRSYNSTAYTPFGTA